PNGRPVPAGLAQAEAALDEHARAWRAVGEALQHRQALAAWPFDAQQEALAVWERELERLGELVTYNQLAARLVEEGLAPLVELGDTRLAEALQHAWFEAILERALVERPELATFSGAAQEIDIHRFRDLDVAIAAYNRATLALAHWDGLPRMRADGGGGGQLALVQREMEKRARWLPIRQLLARAGNAVLHIKPVFMMSPLSIATFLAPEGPSFDLVVFDEASQVKPVDAFGAILRGKQVVVVGDKRQMPPTSFFDTQIQGDDDASETQDFESVLGLMEAQGAPQHMLRWHYRSRHESLIAISNQAFYDGRLVVFPSPDAGREEAGLRLHYLPDAIYERGGSRTNPSEARAVAAAVMAHARTRPGLSLGVAAFSVAQMEAIEAEVEQARRDDPACESYFAAHPHEPFFVKNLETVQGDERDVMMLSTAYGRDADGKLTMNFGPLNLDGGQRRLNVLITRARLRCEVFTSLKAEELPAEAPEGVAALKLFLAYAAADHASVRPAAPVGPAGLEEAIAAEVAALGYLADRHVGASNFFLDLAVRDPERPERYLLAIACDGPNHASARAARDRDRLRAQVLEGLGWQLHRIWALDWLNRPDAERKRLAAALEAARAHVPAPPDPEPLPLEAVARTEEEAPTRSRPTAYVFAEPEMPAPAATLPAVPTNHLARLVADVVAVESPVHMGEVVRRLATAAGSKRPGAKLVAALEGAIAHAAKTNMVRQAGDFLWHPDMEVAPVRDRGAIPAAQRKLELIAPEERQRAVEKAVADACGLARGDVALAAGKLLGYNRPNEEIRAGLESSVEAAIAAGRLVPQGDQVILAD
ncbi:MAG: hypothetical protein JWM80_1566, partial [Cyanobacteria bacterium RYN_339]|nr:hypothetical protein [Cyanobacteria bacterium RYN_339]